MFTNYKELEDEVVNWIDREDIRPRVKGFVDLVTRQASRELRVPTMERVRIVDVYADGSAYIPSDLVELKSIDWITGLTYDINNVLTGVGYRKPLKRGSINNFKKSREAGANTTSKSEPDSFSREGSIYKVYPLPKKAEEVVGGYTGNTEVVGKVEINYFALPVELTDSADSNWLMRVAPEIYLYGTLSHGYEYIRDYETAAFWNQRMENAIKQIQAWSVRADDAGGVIEIPLGG